jgi:hypothetical protein
MNEIKCPNCHKVFKVDDAGFADILKQVRDGQFEKELHERLEIASREKENAIKLAESNLRNLMQEKLAKKDRELIEIKAKKENELREILSKKESEISSMKSKIEKAEIDKKFTIAQTIREIEKERDSLANELEKKENEKLLLKKSLEEKHSTEIKTKNDIIRLKDEEISYRKDMKLKLSTKMIGETLEQHCENEFNKLRATAFQNAYFEKDSDSRTGSKGDYIYRETDESGNEIISIMFEMKNENDETSTKHKNEDFLRELNKDRVEKKCEYAILVSLLEAESELYNTGIIDVSHKYPKMYVIRPQFFIQIITLLRNASMNSLKYKKELALIRNQNIDITNFEDKIENWKEVFAKKSDLYSRKLKTAIEEIDKTINHLQKTKDALLSSENILRLTNNKVEDLTIKKLTRSNPTMMSKFKEITNAKQLEIK